METFACPARLDNDCFFFSSRRRHTRWTGDWSSDVCSSDLGSPVRAQIRARVAANYRHLVGRNAAAPACRVLRSEGGWYAVLQVPTLRTEEELVLDLLVRSEERRVGKEC